MKTRRLLWSFVALFAVIAAAYFLQFPDVTRPMFTNTLFLIPPVLALGAGIYNVKVYGLSSSPGKVAAFMTAGVACWFAGESLFYIFQFIANVDPFPSAADVFYMAAYPLIFIGLIKQILSQRSVGLDFNRLVKLLAGLVSVLLAFIVGYFGIYLAYDPSAPLLNNIVTMGYGVGDLFLIIPLFFILKLAMEFRGGRLFYSWMTVLFALLLILMGDILFAIYVDQYSALIKQYTLIDLTWTAAYLMLAYSFFFNAQSIKELQSRMVKKDKSAE